MLDNDKILEFIKNADNTEVAVAYTNFRKLGATPGVHFPQGSVPTVEELLCYEIAQALQEEITTRWLSMYYKKTK